MPEDPDRVRIHTELLPHEGYYTVTDVPMPVRQKIREAALAGVTYAELAALYDIPVDWIELYCNG